MSEFLKSQLDYIYFIYGLAFVLLAAICFTMHKDKAGLPWKWLGLFGLTHGINEWLDMLALTVDDTPAFAVIRLSVMTLSFVFLLEFGRAGWRRLRGAGPGQWIHIPLLAAAAAGCFAGLNGANAAVRYSFALTGGLWSALVFWQAAKTKDAVSGSRLLVALGFAGYALTAGAIVPAAPFYPASAVNMSAFLAVTGMPVQLVRALFAVTIGTALWACHQRLHHDTETAHRPRMQQGMQIAFALAVVLVAGWVTTDRVGRHGEMDMRKNLGRYAGIAAAALKPADVTTLTGAAADAKNPAYLRLRQQLMQMQRSNPELRWLRLIILDVNGHMTQVADSLPVGAEGHLEPDNVVYAHASRELRNRLARDLPVAEGPYTDKRGSFVSGYAPVQKPIPGQTVVLAMDADATHWRIDVAEYRLGPISVTFLVSLLLIGFFVVRQRLWESGEVLKNSLAEQARLIHELTHTLAEVKTLRGLLPICAACKRVRDDKGNWAEIEGYIQQRSDAQFTHSYCPDCMQKLHPEYYRQIMAEEEATPGDKLS